MRIVMVNWARIWHGATKGGGVNGYVQSLALGLLERGHEVISLSSGTRRTGAKAGPAAAAPPGRRAGETGCHVRRLPDWLGVRVFEVFNSPVLAPSIRQISDPEPEIACPELDRAVGDLFEMLRPDLVHVHSLEGFSAGLIDRARCAGARVVFSLHNYHTICPQVYLMQESRIPCTDFEGGRACARCAHAAARERDKPRSDARSSRPTNRDQAGAGRRGGVGAIGTRVRSPADVHDPRELAEPDLRGMTQRVLAERAGDRPGEAGWIAIDNAIESEPVPLGSSDPYARRRAAMVAALNSCDRVLAVSRFVADKFRAMGVSGERIERMRIGTRLVEVVRDQPGAIAAPVPLARSPDRPIRVVFIGHNNRYKGLGVLIDAVGSLETSRSSRVHLEVCAQGVETVEDELGMLEPRLARLSVVRGYDVQDIPRLVGGADLGVVPSTWWDNGPQTVLEFQACGVPVLGARVGGVPDFVAEGVDGALFRGGDPEDLARVLGGLIDDPVRLDEMRASVRAPISLDEHLEALIGVYRRCLGARSEPG